MYEVLLASATIRRPQCFGACCDGRCGAVVRPLLGGAAGNQRVVPGVPRGVKRSILLMASICVAMIAALAAIFIVPAADPVHQIAVQTAKTAGIPDGVAPGPPGHA